MKEEGQFEPTHVGCYVEGFGRALGKFGFGCAALTSHKHCPHKR
jgi:hypothetical protein